MIESKKKKDNERLMKVAKRKIHNAVPTDAVNTVNINSGNDANNINTTLNPVAKDKKQLKVH